MKYTYPVVFTPYPDGGYMAYVPDLNINTEGSSFDDAVQMARDAIGLVGITLEDEGKSVPVPSPIGSIRHDEGALLSLVEIDFVYYRRKADTLHQ